MAGVNKVILLGRLGKDPDVRTLDNGAKVCSFSIATSETYKDKDGQRQERTEWHNIVLWRALADIAERFLTKGREVYIEGKLQTRKWQDQNGMDRYTTEIVGSNLNLIGGRNDMGNPPSPSMTNEPQATSQSSPQAASSSAFDSNDDEDDLPF